MGSKAGEWTMNRVHPEKEEHSTAYYAQITNPDDQYERQTLCRAAPPFEMPPMSPPVSKIEQAKPPGTATFDPVVPDPPRNSDASRQTWKLLTKAALLVGALNPKDKNVIDIYHAPKVGTSRFMIHPNSKSRRLWDVITAGLVLYVITVVRPRVFPFALGCARALLPRHL